MILVTKPILKRLKCNWKWIIKNDIILYIFFCVLYVLWDNTKNWVNIFQMYGEQTKFFFLLRYILKQFKNW